MVGAEAHLRSWLEKFKQACVSKHGTKCKYQYKSTKSTSEVLLHAGTCPDCPKEVRDIIDMSISKSTPELKMPKQKLFTDLYEELSSSLHNPVLKSVPST
jgi:hypothetical protein